MQGFESFMGVVGIFVAYWVPTIIALVRHAPSTGSTAVVNGFLGWTGVGWIVALAMACRSSHRAEHGNRVTT